MALGDTKKKVRPVPPQRSLDGNLKDWEAYFRRLDEYAASLEARIKELE
jgi:hypothetical protein